MQSRTSSRALSSIALVAALALGAPTLAVTVHADSVAEFSGTQGAAGWSYGYYTSPDDFASFVPMTVWHDHTTHQEWHETQTQPPWTTLTRFGGHPGIVNGVVHQAVRRWESDVAGTVWISGTLEDLDPVLAGGVAGKILHNGTIVFSQVVDAYPDSPYGPPSVDYLVPVSVAVGDVIDFAIDPNGSEGYDTTRFTALITDTPPAVAEPGPTGLLALAAAGVLACRRRRVVGRPPAG